MMTRRVNGEADGELESCFASVLVPYRGDTCPVASAKYCGNLVKLTLIDGRVMRAEFTPEKEMKIKITVNGDELK